MMRRPFLIRWTIGDVGDLGFDALRLSTWGAQQLFGDAMRYVVCVNSVELETARARTGVVPEVVEWRQVSPELSPVIRRRTAGNMAEGVAWKFAPMRIDPDAFELHLDNDCILWDTPDAMRRWLEDDTGRCLLAEDVTSMLGQFERWTGRLPRNSGIRGIPPGFDLERELERVLDLTGVTLSSELDEQGMVTLACSGVGDPYLVTVDDVSICGPFPPHRQQLGRCGAHFVGLNAKQLPWAHDGKSGEWYVRENYLRFRAEIEERIAVRS